jgi:hypothetical protein
MQTPTKGSLPQFAGLKGHAFRTLREAVHHTATQNGPMKNIASERPALELCLRTTLGTDNARPLPLDDPAERAVNLQQLTGDFSILITMAEKCGFELRPKHERLPEFVAHLASEAKRLNESIQLVLSTPWVQQKKGR